MDLMDLVTQSGCLYEVSSENMLAIDASPEKAQLTADTLYGLEKAGLLEFETGRTR